MTPRLREDSAMSDVYLSAINYELGVRLTLDSLEEPRVDALAAALRQEGLHYVCVSREESWRLAASAAARTLKGQRRPDATVYTSDDTEPPNITEALSSFESELELRPAPAFAVGGHGCGNFGPALRVAAGLLRAEGWTSVLLSTADRAGGKSRLRTSSLSVLSDGAATCLLTTTKPAGPSFRLLGVTTVTSPLPDVEGAGYEAARLTLRGVGNAVEAVCHTLSCARSDFTHVLLNNYGATARRLLAMAARVSSAQVINSNVADTGHCFSADALVNLHRGEAEGLFQHGQRLLIISNGAASWSVIAVEYVIPSVSESPSTDKGL